MGFSVDLVSSAYPVPELLKRTLDFLTSFTPGDGDKGMIEAARYF